ncbi:MAG: prolipoprotein diacylglyceryl transferase [Solobacterium sp.]|nr:prolipoprotein diacylglyceryl transferase [Solobacterium sp.]
MYNDWLTIGPLTIHGYGAMIAIGILCAFWLGERQARRHGLQASEVDNLVFVCLAVGYFFSKFTYTVINFKDFLADPWSVISSGGWVVYGGILGGIFGGWVYCRIKKLDFFAYFNMLIPTVALAQAFGRIGCFFAGCCYGVPTSSALGVTFPAGSLAPSGMKLVPTQLLSSAGDFLIFAVLYKIYENEKTRPETAAWYLILYSAGRFMIEFLRGDAERGSIGPLSTSQFIAIFVMAAGVILLVMIRNRNKNIRQEASA